MRSLRIRAVTLVAALATVVPLVSQATAHADPTVYAGSTGTPGAVAWDKDTLRLESGSCPTAAPDTTAGAPDNSLANFANQDWGLNAFFAALAGRQDPFIANRIVGDPHSLYNVEVGAAGIHTDTWYRNGYFGQGVGVALIDTGVAPVQGLNNGNVIYAEDNSFEHNTAFANIDTFGHGTHMASIIAGRDDSNGTATATHKPYSWGDPTKFMGIAPAAKIVSVKVGDASGAVDATQVTQAVRYITRHKNDFNPPIRVMNLSVGFDAGLYGDWRYSDLSQAVDAAWQAGIVVVAATGNGSQDTTKAAPGVASPAFNKRILAIGSYDDVKGTVTDFSQSGSSTNNRQPDLVAPGQSMLALSDPGSTQSDEIVARCHQAMDGYTDPITQEQVAPTGTWTSPEVGPGGRFVLGSGTSQSTAVVTGAVALMLSNVPGNTRAWQNPDWVKRALRNSAQGGLGLGQLTNGQGVIDMNAAWSTSASNGPQSVTTPTGGESWDLDRGVAKQYSLAADGTVTYSYVNDFLWDGSTKQVEIEPGACTPGTYWYNFAQQYGFNWCQTAPNTLSGNIGIDGKSLDPTTVAKAIATNTDFTVNSDGSESWMGQDPISTTYTQDPVLGTVLSGRSWSSMSWTGRAWSALEGRSWSGRGWAGNSLSGRGWADYGFLGRAWSGRGWADHNWLDSTWG